MTPITIIQDTNAVIINGGAGSVPIFNFTPFAVTATVDGQTQFTLPTDPIFMIWVSIQGVVQSQLAGDYTFAGNILTFSSGVSQGELIAGLYV